MYFASVYPAVGLHLMPRDGDAARNWVKNFVSLIVSLKPFFTATQQLRLLNVAIVWTPSCWLYCATKLSRCSITSAAVISCHPPAGCTSRSYSPNSTDTAGTTPRMYSPGLWLVVQAVFSPNTASALSVGVRRIRYRPM